MYHSCREMYYTQNNLSRSMGRLWPGRRACVALEGLVARL